MSDTPPTAPASPEGISCYSFSDTLNDNYKTCTCAKEASDLTFPGGFSQGPVCKKHEPIRFYEARYEHARDAKNSNFLVFSSKSFGDLPTWFKESCDAFRQKNEKADFVFYYLKELDIKLRPKDYRMKYSIYLSKQSKILKHFPATLEIESTALSNSGLITYAASLLSLLNKVAIWLIKGIFVLNREAFIEVNSKCRQYDTLLDGNAWDRSHQKICVGMQQWAEFSYFIVHDGNVNGLKLDTRDNYYGVGFHHDLHHGLKEIAQISWINCDIQNSLFCYYVEQIKRMRGIIRSYGIDYPSRADFDCSNILECKQQFDRQIVDVFVPVTEKKRYIQNNWLFCCGFTTACTGDSFMHDFEKHSFEYCKHEANVAEINDQCDGGMRFKKVKRAAREQTTEDSEEPPKKIVKLED